MILRVQMTDTDEQYAPPEHCLELQLVGKDLFLTWGKYDEASLQYTFKDKINCTVEITSFMRTLELLVDDWNRNSGQRSRRTEKEEFDKQVNYIATTAAEAVVKRTSEASAKAEAKPK